MSLQLIRAALKFLPDVWGWIMSLQNGLTGQFISILIIAFVVPPVVDLILALKKVFVWLMDAFRG